ncbi:MAG: porin [Bacteroidetes bacterium]|nr:porin [Bacteroidota bacterium]
MLRNIILSTLTITSSLAACAQSDTTHPVLTITGSADLYYRYDLTKSDKNNFTSFTNSQNQFQLGMASVKIERKTERLDLVADIGVGPRAREFSYNDNGITQAIKQLYISYSFNNWLKVTAGTWGTHIGYEVLDPGSNRNYSMSYLFTNGPFSNTGVKADFTTGKSGFMIGISNPTDFRSVPSDGHNNKTIIAQYSYAASDNLKVYLNYSGGRDIEDNRAHQYDFVLTARTSTLFSFGINGSVNKSSLASEKYSSSRSWWGAATYLNLDPKPWFGLTLRTEYFNDEKGIRLPAPASLVANTLSANFKVEGFTFIPEFRLENANIPIFTKHDGSAASSAASFLLAAVYTF